MGSAPGPGRHRRTRGGGQSGFLKEVLLPAGKLAIAQHLQSKTAPDQPQALPDREPSRSAPAHPVAASSRAFLASLRPKQWWQLTDRLTDRQQTLLRCAGDADTDDQAVHAIVALREELTADLAHGLALREILSGPHWSGLQKITALAMQVARGGAKAQDPAAAPAAENDDSDTETDLEVE